MMVPDAEDCYSSRSSAFRESRHATQGRRGPDSVHGGARALTNRGMMQAIERSVVRAGSLRRWCSESEDRVPVGREVRWPHREGDSVVGELDEPRELFVVQRRVRANDPDRRPGSRLRALEVFFGDVGHLPISLPVLLKGAANRAVLEGIIDVADAVRHDDCADGPRADASRAAPESSLRAALLSEERSQGGPGPGA